MAGVLAMEDLAAGAPLVAAAPPARLSSAGAGAGWAKFFPCCSKQSLYSLNGEGGPQWAYRELVTLAGYRTHSFAYCAAPCAKREVVAT